MENYWRLLAEFEYPHVSKDFICILCKKILYDARISACGCRFCAECIENYLDNENTTCPGQREDCRDVILNLSENISKDHVMNRNISKIKLECPISECFYNDDLTNLANHLKECRKLAIRCPYFEQGCNYMSLTQDDIDKHLELQKDSHISLMFSRIKNLNQNVEVLRGKSKSWKTKLKYSEEVIFNLENEMKEKERTIKSNEQTEKELQDLKVEFNELYIEMTDLKSTMKNILGSLSKPLTWKFRKIDSTYQHSDQHLLYPSGPLMLLRSYIEDQCLEICVFMVKGDSNRKTEFPLKCIINISISNSEDEDIDITNKITKPTQGISVHFSSKVQPARTGLFYSIKKVASIVKFENTKIFSSGTDAHQLIFNSSDDLENILSKANRVLSKNH